MHSQTTLRVAGLLVSLLLGGCATNKANTSVEASPALSGDGVSTSVSAGPVAASPPQPAAAALSSAEEARIAHARQAARAAGAAAIPNPSIVTFEKMSTALHDKGKQVIAQLADRAKSSRKVTVTGFCDRNQIGNSADAAVARAISVRDELLAQGVTPANIVVRFNTKVAKKHAAEVRFD